MHDSDLAEVQCLLMNLQEQAIGRPLPETNHLQLLLASALASIGVYYQFQAQQNTTLFAFGEHMEYFVEWKYSRYCLNQRRGINWLFLLDDEDPVEFAAATALHIANERIEATLYRRSL